MNEAMKQAWLEITQMMGVTTPEELDVFLRTWQRATEAHKKALAEQPALMSQPNRLIAYSAASKLRELGYEWLNDAWTHLDELAEQPARCAPAEDGVCESLDCPNHKPAQRTWGVGLTDEEMLTLEETITCTKEESWLRNLTRAIEAKLRERNT